MKPRPTIEKVTPLDPDGTNFTMTVTVDPPRMFAPDTGGGHSESRATWSPGWCKCLRKIEDIWIELGFFIDC